MSFPFFVGAPPHSPDATAAHGFCQVGELALLHGETRSASVVAQPGGTGVVAWSLTRARFRSLAAAADARSLATRLRLLHDTPGLLRDALSSRQARAVHFFARPAAWLASAFFLDRR